MSSTIQTLLNEITTLRINDSNPARLSHLENMLHQYNITNRNSVRIHTMASNLLTDTPTIRRMRAFLESSVQHALITAPTQVGKTEAMIKMIIECMDNKVAVIVSSDNKTDQQEQIHARIQGGLMGMPFELLQASDRKLGRKLTNALDQDLIPITFCLDNFSQIHKTAVAYLQMVKRRYRNKVDKIVILHDEGDVVTKSEESYINHPTNARSHTEWVEMVEDMKDFFQIKRMFVTATPENCVMKYNIPSPYIIKFEKTNESDAITEINRRN